MYSVIWQLIRLKQSLIAKRLEAGDGARVLSSHRVAGGDGSRVQDLLLSVARDRNIDAHRPGFWLLFMAGVLGVVTMVGLMQSTPGQPINLLYLLLVFGPLQWVLMVFALLGVTRDSAPYIQPLLAKGLGKFDVPHRLLGSFFFHLTQSMSLAFILSGCFTFVVMLAFRDLSFGWETTFQWDSATLAALLHALATPWAGVWPEAVPSTEWVNQTRFYRLASQTITQDVAGYFGQWWPFVAAYLITYSVIPRAVLWGIGQLLLSRKMAIWVATDPELQQALDQLHEQEKKLTISGVPTDARHELQVSAQDTQGVPGSVPTADVTFYWKVTLPKDSGLSAIQLGLPDNWIQDTVITAQQAAETVWNVIVPGWEAPTAELSDLLKPLQTQHSIRLILKTLGKPLSKGQRISWEQFHQEQLPHTQLLVWAEEQ